MRRLFTLLFLPLLLLSNVGWGQATIFSENIGTPTGTTTIVSYAAGTAPATFQNKGTLTYSNGGAASSADIRNTSVSSGYTGASGNGNVFFTTTSGSYGFSIESIDASLYSNLTLSYGYRKESATAHASFSVEYWDGSAWQIIANTSAALFNEAATAGVAWYAAKSLSLPAAAQISGLKIRFVKSGTLSIRIDDIKLTGTPATPTTTSLSPTSVLSGTPGFTLTVNGTNFVPSSTVTWNGANRTTTYVSNAQLTANIPATDITTAGTATVGVTTPSAAASSNTQTFTINPNTSGTFSLTSGVADFGAICTNTNSTVNSFTFDGNNLDGTPITVGALAGYSYSTSASGPFTSTLTINYSGSSFTGQVVYVQFSPTTVQSYNGNINLSGGSVTSYPVPVTGSGVNTTPSLTTSSNSATGTTAIMNGTINSQGCTAITDYGIEYSNNSGFADGTGTKISSTNLSGGNFSSSLNGLTPNLRYYYKAYATNAGGTGYGVQQAFNAPPVPVIMSAQPAFTYTETFSDIANWANFFAGGVGSEHFSQATGSTGTIPSATNVTSTTVFSSGSSGGVQRGTDQIPPLTPTQSIVLLSTGTTDNSSSAAFDIYFDFTGVNAGTLSFDYQTLNNGGTTDNRSGSLKIYATVDGTNYTEVTNVLNFSNNIPVAGSKTNIPLPASFNNSATARLRFYYYNGTGGTTGSRPKISLDNIVVTAVTTTPCTAPTAPATSLTFGTINDVSIAGSFTAANPAVDQYLIVASTNSSLTSNPIDGQIYNVGDNLGEGTVVAKGSSTNFTATGLSASTTYYFFVFPLNAVCSGGPLYYTTNTLSGQATTAAGLPPCVAPSVQPTTLTFGTTTTNSIQGSFTGTTADGYLVVRSTSSSLSTLPTNGQSYTAGDVIGNGVVVDRANVTSFTANNLSPNTTYYFFVFSYNSQVCVNGPAYNTSSPLTSSTATQPLPPCNTPSAQPINLALHAANTAIAGNFQPSASADAYLIVRSTSSILSAAPIDNTTYAIGDNLGGGIVVSNSSSNTFMNTGLIPGTTYYYFIFAMNSNCTGGPKYLAASPLSGNIPTLNTIVNSYYFGTLHSHSDYSDGNQDNPGYTPTDDYNYAMTAQCMDYLGISEHNHFSSPDNPGNKISTYHQGLNEATTFSAAHPNFLALYGMEWGVISGGGHVVVYGDGLNDLLGWESGSGAWGPTNNYDVYVAKSDYTGPNGLFKTVNGYVAQNAFATLAHPNPSDFNNLAGNAYNAVADSAITGTAVESGPATSTNTTYSNPGSSMYYLWYYQTLLSKGYHLGPTIDHDNHNTTFGHTTLSRTAIIAPALTKPDIIAAMRNMHFYATQDCDTKVDFMINARMMGSVFTDRYAPVMSVTLSDATTSTSNAKVRLFYGQPGNGVLPVQVDSAIGSSVTFTDNALANGATGYYYIEVANGNSRIVTSPIWYTRNDNNGFILPVKLASFTATKEGSAVRLNWTTAQEKNTKEFVIERSVDGARFDALTTVAAKGNSSTPVNYSIVDSRPNQGNNFYHLKTVDADGKSELSNVVKINFTKGFTVSLSPNPANDYVLVNLTGVQQTVTMQLVNAAGEMIKKVTLTNGANRVSVSGLAKGLYLLKFTGLDEGYTEKLIVQ